MEVSGERGRLERRRRRETWQAILITPQGARPPRDQLCDTRKKIAKVILIGCFSPPMHRV